MGGGGDGIFVFDFFFRFVLVFALWLEASAVSSTEQLKILKVLSKSNRKGSK